MYKTLLFLMMMAPAVALAASEEGSIDLSESQRFAEQRAAIETALSDGETYAEIEPAKREEVRAAMARIGAALESSGGMDGMSEEQKVSLFNDQELANTILTRARADSRMICRREMRVGSHRPVNHCESVADRRRAAEDAQEHLRSGRSGLDPSS